MAAQNEVNNGKNNRLVILLAMAMFVLVVDTSIMNVSVSAIVEDLGTTVSDIQAAIALLPLSMFGIALLA